MMFDSALYFQTVITFSNQFDTASLQKNVYPFSVHLSI